MQRYGHKTYDVIRIKQKIYSNVDMIMAKQPAMTDKSKGKNHKIIFIASL